MHESVMIKEKKRGILMKGYVLTKGQEFIVVEPTGKITKSTKNRTVFPDVQEATSLLLRATAKTKGFVVQTYDSKDFAECKEIPAIQNIVKRKTYSEDVRKLIYHQCKGRCKICGKPVDYKDMTLDHIIPLASGGREDVSNLQCTHMECNQVKGRLSSDQFLEMITNIFLYQMHIRHRRERSWKKILKHFLRFTKGYR